MRRRKRLLALVPVPDDTLRDGHRAAVSQLSQLARSMEARNPLDDVLRSWVLDIVGKGPRA